MGIWHLKRWEHHSVTFPKAQTPAPNIHCALWEEAGSRVSFWWSCTGKAFVILQRVLPCNIRAHRKGERKAREGRRRTWYKPQPCHVADGARNLVTCTGWVPAVCWLKYLWACCAWVKNRRKKINLKDRRNKVKSKARFLKREKTELHSLTASDVEDAV